MIVGFFETALNDCLTCAKKNGNVMTRRRSGGDSVIKSKRDYFAPTSCCFFLASMISSWMFDGVWR